MLRTLAFLFAATGFIALSAAQSNSGEISAITANRTAVLGGAYQSDKEEIVGQACVEGSEAQARTFSSSFTFEQSLSQAQASDQLGFKFGARARFGATSASAAARFLQASTSNKLSVSAVWISDYKLPTRRLNNPSLNAIGNAVRDNYERWAETCGDEYVLEIVEGARLFFSIRVDFESERQKQEFQASFSLSGPLYSASASLEQASQRFARDTKVMVSAFQLGGDVSKITEIISANDGVGNYVQCTLGDFDRCANMIGSALTYATDTESGFPSQISKSPAALEYITASYSSAGLYSEEYPFLAEATKEARRELHQKFESNFSYLILANRFLEYGVSDNMLADITHEKARVEANLAEILQASRTCYELPAQCFDVVRSLSLAAINDSVFVLPPTPTADFRVYTPGRGLWTREESVAAVHRTLSSVATDAQTFVVQQGDVVISQHSLDPRLKVLESLAPNASASIVLLIKGEALKSAVLYFEDVRLGELPLATGVITYPAKRGEDFAFLVIRSTRENPGWIDFDLDSYRESLWIETLKTADGIFQVAVHDEFGRVTRFDVEYQKWSRSERVAQGRYVLNEVFSYRNRWWEAEGTSIASDSSWSEVGELKREVSYPQPE